MDKRVLLILKSILQMAVEYRVRNRLDIDEDDISDEELAKYIIEDMRLLMVGEVRILNKKIINEKHKRRPSGENFGK